MCWPPPAFPSRSRSFSCDPTPRVRSGRAVCARFDLGAKGQGRPPHPTYRLMPSRMLRSGVDSLILALTPHPLHLALSTIASRLPPPCPHPFPLTPHPRTGPFTRWFFTHVICPPRYLTDASRMGSALSFSSKDAWGARSSCSISSGTLIAWLSGRRQAIYFELASPTLCRHMPCSLARKAPTPFRHRTRSTP